jgi:hypothetical protein
MNPPHREDVVKFRLILFPALVFLCPPISGLPSLAQAKPAAAESSLPARVKEVGARR